MSALRKNVASQVITFCLVNATTGAALTGATVTTKVTLDGTQSASAGTLTELGTGQYKYVPTQGETNGASVGFCFTATNAVPVNLHCFTTSQDPTIAQTGDAYARLGAPAGASVSVDIAAVKVDTAAVKAKTDNLPATPADEATLTAMKGATFAGATDSLEAIRDRGDAAWATATGFATPTNITAATGIDITKILGTAISTPATAGILDVNVKNFKGSTAVGGSTPGLPDARLAEISLGGGIQLRLNVGLADADLDTQLGAIDDLIDTEVGAIKTKTDYLPSATAGAAGGLFIAGANAATSITGALTANIAGSMSGNVEGNVNGSVGSVVGNVGGNVNGSVGSVVGFTPSNIADIISTLGNPDGASVSVDIAAVKNDTALMKGATFDTATDSLEAIRDRGDAAWDTATGFSTLDAAGVRTAIGLATANLDTQLAAIDDYLDTEVAAIKAKTDNLPASPSSLDAAGVRAAVGLATANLDTQLAAIDDLLDTEIGAIKAKTDLIPAAPASTTNITAASGITVSAIGANVITTASIADDAITEAKIAELALVPKHFDAGIVMGSVTGAVGSVTAGVTVTTNNDKTGYTLTSGERNSVADALLDRTDGATANYTFREALEVMLAAMAGKVSGAGTVTITFRDINDTKNVIVATVDTSAGNRTAVTVTP